MSAYRRSRPLRNGDLRVRPGNKGHVAISVQSFRCSVLNRADTTNPPTSSERRACGNFRILSSSQASPASQASQPSQPASQASQAGQPAIEASGLQASMSAIWYALRASGRRPCPAFSFRARSFRVSIGSCSAARRRAAPHGRSGGAVGRGGASRRPRVKAALRATLGCRF